jgi:multisubunit Na+/H+ antiporter MnhC subunit
MTDDDGAAIDPRYDPAFQRGFSGEVQTGAHGQSALRRTAAVNPASTRPMPQRTPESRFAPAATVSSEFAPVAAEPEAGVFAPVPEAAVSPGGSDAEALVVTTPRQLARNPFVIGLAALAVVLILAGALWAYEGFATIVKNGGTRNEVEFWAAQTMSFGAPLAIVVGLSVVAVLLVLFGRSWQRSR